MQPHHRINHNDVFSQIILTTITMLPDDGDCAETCRSCFNVNFIILSKQLSCASVGK